MTPSVIKITLLASLTTAFAWRCAYAEPTIMSLSCKGKISTAFSFGLSSPSPDSGASATLEVVVNLTDRSVSFQSYVVPIVKMEAADVYFNSNTPAPGGLSQLSTIEGAVNRVTGVFFATVNSKDLITDYDLICKPTTHAH